MRWSGDWLQIYRQHRRWLCSFLEHYATCKAMQGEDKAWVHCIEPFMLESRMLCLAGPDELAAVRVQHDRSWHGERQAPCPAVSFGPLHATLP